MLYGRKNTKENRNASREAQFTNLLNSGYKQETYKALDFFTHEDGKHFTLKVYRGTAANHCLYINYRSAERRAEVIQQYKDSHESRQAYKTEQKEKNKGKSSSHAATAAAIKAELTALYPGIKFSCTSDSYSMGDSVTVKWTDGPKSAEVDEIIKKYQYGHFDGMNDMYESSNRRSDIPQSKYVSSNRNYSDEIEAILLPDAERLFNADHYNYIHTAQHFMQQVFYHCSIPTGATVTGIVPTGETTGTSRPEIFFTIGYTLPETAEQQQPNFTPVEVTKGEINIIDYSDKAFAVIGTAEDLKALQPKMYELGGKWNKYLSCGPGYIFSKKRLEIVTAALSEEPTPEKPTEQNTAPAVIEVTPQPATVETPLIYVEGPETTKTETPILPTPQTSVFILEYFKIIWHEGHQNPNYENTTFYNWHDIQTAFVRLWERNERGQEGGYTKVKCEMKFLDQEVIIDRIDITDKISNGDFNPSQEHIIKYLESIVEEETKEDKPEQYKTLPDIKAAANNGKVISLFNLSELVNQKS